MRMTMTKGLIGKKLGMTQIFSDEGASVPVTVIEVEPSVVIQKKTRETDGYDALQLGYGRIKQRNVTKALQGHFKKADKGLFRFLREFNMDPEGCEPGQELNAEMFSPGDYVDGSMFHRAPGSIGASADPSRVFKGTKLPGHMGCERKTVQNLLVWAVRPDMNVILVRGAVPGSKNGFVLIKQAIKKGQ
jgi:large subunit ribosomal protein L3